jgi:sulfate permease, SulP family
VNLLLPLSRILPSKRDFPGFRSSWRHDLLAGVAVGVVALPLALAFGISTGTGAASGLVTAIVAGFIAALFGGSRFQVSGPTGAMTVVLVPIVAKYGVGIMPIVGLMAGLIIILLGIFKLGRYLAAVPWAVLEGFTVGIGIVIALQQLPLALDIAKPDGSNAARVAWATLKIAINDGFKSGPVIILITAITLMLISVRFTKTIPASIVAVIFCTLILFISPLEAKTIGDLPRSLPMPKLPDLAEIPTSGWSAIIYAAFAVAALGAIESILSARVADAMEHAKTHLHDGEKHDSDRELFGQGLGTVAASMMGGIPATGAIARTAVNVRSGARTRFSAMVHSMLLLLCVLLFAPIVGQIPISALAGILMVTAARMVNPVSVREALVTTRSSAIVLITTAFITVAVDLIWAVGIGLLLNLALTKFPKIPMINKVIDQQ